MIKMIKTREDYLARKREVQRAENLTDMQYRMAITQVAKEYKDSLRMALLESSTIKEGTETFQLKEGTETFQLKVDYIKAKQDYNKYKILELQQETIELERIYQKEWKSLSNN